MKSSYFILTLIVAVPFLISMIILYSVSLKARRRNAAEGEGEEPNPNYCKAELLAAIVKKSHGGENDERKVACTGFVIGDNILLAVEGCISDTEQSDHYVTSGSLDLTNSRNVHRIRKVTKINSVHSTNGGLMVLEVQPRFPACIRRETGIPISKAAKLKDTIDLSGWLVGTPEKNEMLQAFTVSDSNRGCQIFGGLFYDAEKTNYGLLKKCTDNSYEVIFLVHFIDILRFKYKSLGEIIIED